MDILCLSHLRWDFVFQRPQHLLSRAVKRGRVFYVEEPVFDGESFRAVQVIMTRKAADLAELARLVQEGALKPRLSETMNLTQAREAQELSENGKTHGKVILKVA